LTLATGTPRAAELDLNAYDEDNARDVHEICAACHGEFGQGGGDGEYPRLAGLPAGYIVAQVEDFKARTRLNISMLPFATERELPAEDVRDIAIYLSRLELPTAMPAFEEGTDSYAKLLAARRVFNVPRLQGDLARGKAVLKRGCAKCHGKRGEGRAQVPPLAGQYSSYIQRQIDQVLAGKRNHPDKETYLQPYGEDDWRALLAYLSTLDD
jgi:cytochrome c553